MKNRSVYKEPKMDIIELISENVVCNSSEIYDEKNEEPEELVW